MTYRRRKATAIRQVIMIHRNRPKPVGVLSNKYNPSEVGLLVHVLALIYYGYPCSRDHQINDNCFNEPSAVSSYKDLYLDLHGLIFETSM